MRALICEDDPSIRALVLTVLKRQGFTVDVAENGAVGLERLEENCYDLLVLDLMMPGIDGYGVLRRLKDERPTNLKRVVVMTAAVDAIREFPEQICTLLPKPFDIGALVNAAKRCAAECERR
jgi:DNA-binding response OmpR family regulator